MDLPAVNAADHPTAAFPPSCPLCLGAPSCPFSEVRGHCYFECPVCKLVFLSPEQRPTPEVERAHYGTHQNDPGDPGYRAFLNRLAGPLVQELSAGARGLDYGAGPGPTLSVMLAEQGFPTAVYDPYFAPDKAPLQHPHDFITCSETVEHFHAPAADFALFDALLRPGGWLGIMTQTREPARPFHAWHYVQDPTHVCFYHEATFAWIASAYGWTLELPAKNVALFHKPDGFRG